MTDMIERVALAMANHDADKLDLPKLQSIDEIWFTSERDELLSMAKAAIKEMREPAPEMCRAGDDALGRCERVYQDMIDAALGGAE